MSETGRTGPPRSPEPAGPGAEPDEATYATRIEEAFIKERGTPFLLSAKDWLLIRGFRERGIPVDTVIRAVEETFERRRARAQAGKISSIAYCAGAVEERWEMERRGLVGQGDGVRDVLPEEIAPRLARLTGSLGEAADRRPEGIDPDVYRAKVEGVREKVAALPAGGGFDAVEEDLAKMERGLLKALEKGLLGDTRATLDARTVEALGEPAGLMLEARDRMRRALFRRELRRYLELPPLTLFGS